MGDEKVVLDVPVDLLDGLVGHGDLTLGFALSNPSSVNEQRVRDAATRGKLHAFLRSLPADRFPALVVLGEYVWVDRDQRFTTGLDTLVDGLEAARRRHRRGSGRQSPP